MVKFKSSDLFRWVGQFAEVLAAKMSCAVWSQHLCLMAHAVLMLPVTLWPENDASSLVTWRLIMPSHLHLIWGYHNVQVRSLVLFDSRSSVDIPAVFSLVNLLVGWRTEVIECFSAVLMSEQFFTDMWCRIIGLGKSSWKLATLLSGWHLGFGYFGWLEWGKICMVGKWMKDLSIF